MRRKGASVTFLPVTKRGSRVDLNRSKEGLLSFFQSEASIAIFATKALNWKTLFPARLDRDFAFREELVQVAPVAPQPLGQRTISHSFSNVKHLLCNMDSIRPSVHHPRVVTSVAYHLRQVTFFSTPFAHRMSVP